MPELPPGPYTVRQEVNTSQPGKGEDIADLVLENEDALIVVENYETSDGHGHSYTGYQKFSRRGGKIGTVVILCVEEDKALQSQGWEQAPVVTYERFLNQLVAELDHDPVYAKRNPEQYALIRQMHRKYASGKGRMSDKNVLEFVTVMCDIGEAERYRIQNHEVAAERFASDVAQQARETFEESRRLLLRAKSSLRNFCATTLARQMNETLGYAYVQKATAKYSGIYQWTINFEVAGGHASFGDNVFQIKFGPSAWYANERDSYFAIKVPQNVPDYSRLLLSGSKYRDLHQSEVTLYDVLEGLGPNDRRLHDEIMAILVN